MAKTSKPNRSPSIQVGDRVLVRFGGGRTDAVVVEDRGHIGKGGRRLLRVRRGEEDSEDSLTYELPEEDVVLKSPRKARRAVRAS